MTHFVVNALCSLLLATQADSSKPPECLRARVSWGHHAPSRAPYFVKLVPAGAELADEKPLHLEETDGLKDGAWQGVPGEGDVDGCDFILVYVGQSAKQRRKEHVIWTYLLREGHPGAAERLRQDPSFDPDSPLLTVQMNSEATRGFSVSIDQLVRNRALWVPDLDVYLTAGRPFASFEDHCKSLEQFKGQRVLDLIHAQPEATYEQFTSLWADMGDPRNDHPNHIVGVTWDSAIPKFGIDRLARVSSDLGNPDRLRFAFDFRGFTWVGQKLEDGLPIVTTLFEKDGLCLELEQFAYPLNGPPR